MRHQWGDADLVFVTTNTFGLSLGILRRLGLLRAQVVFLAMGLVEPTTPRRWRSVFRWALADTHVLALAQTDARILTETLHRNVPYLPFGVDHQFWTPAAETDDDGYVLSVGNDRHRDYATLLTAWRADFPPLKIVTRLPVHSDAANVEILHGDWHMQSFSDSAIRDLIHRARLIVLPITNTVQPSGQSAALQAMACGKAVVLTDYPGLWNREVMRDGETCLLAGAPRSAEDLAQAITRTLNDPNLAPQIGRNGRTVVENHLNCRIMADHLRHHMETALGRSLLGTSPCLRQKSDAT
ncbi:MAG: glycosyltransferase family 4 protein, partial [Rhodospirillaceae bacterium]|nr:glycosyltransferase family 4 protein [Rhodospirillaceae bacterium]